MAFFMVENEIKKGWDIYLYYWVIPFFILFTLINYFANFLNFNGFDLGLMVSVVSFLFGFFLTICFSITTSRLTALKEANAFETGRLTSFFQLSKYLGAEFHDKVKNFIDQYTRLTLRDYGNYEIGRASVSSLYDSLYSMDLKTEHKKAIANSFLYVLGEFAVIREKLEYLTQMKMIKAMKIANLILASILIMLLFLSRGESFTGTLFVLLSTTIVFILLILEDYDNLKIGDYVINISNAEQLFDLIGKERYYPENLISKVKLEEGKKYRIGFYNKKENQEKIVTLEYNRSFNLKLTNLFSKFRKKEEQSN